MTQQVQQVQQDFCHDFSQIKYKIKYLAEHVQCWEHVRLNKHPMMTTFKSMFDMFSYFDITFELILLNLAWFMCTAYIFRYNIRSK